MPDDMGVASWTIRAAQDAWGDLCQREEMVIDLSRRWVERASSPDARCRSHYSLYNQPIQMLSNNERPPFDEVRAASFVGKHVLVGVAYHDHKDKFLEQRQLHGIIVSADARQGFAIELRGQRSGETFWLPPDLRPFEAARPGEYRLRSTGEVVADPDLLCTWIINKPKRPWWKFW